MSGISDKKHILIVSGEPPVLAEMKVNLMDSFEVSIASEVFAALSAFGMYDMSLVIIHIGNDSKKAFSVFDGISASVKEKDVPVMFLAENGCGEDENKAFECGAVDYAVRGRGTAFALNARVGLRIRENQQKKTAPGKEADSLEVPFGVTEAILDGKTILVADDVRLNREIIAGMLLGINGLTLEFAADGSEAVEKFSKQPDRFSLILMDVQMPVMDGIKAAKAIRNLGYENARRIPIIALTADVDSEDTAKYLKSGMNGFIEKPMDYEQFLDIAAKHCI